MTSGDPEFLDVDDVVELHGMQAGVFGGAEGLRDRGLLESAVAQPKSSFDGQFVHEGLFAMAAAHLFHIVRNNPSWTGTSARGFLRRWCFSI